MSNIISATFSCGSTTASASGLWQYDYGQKLIFAGLDLPPVYEVHFANEGETETITVLGNETGVDIPDQFLLSGNAVRAWVFLHTGTEDGETMYAVRMPVNKRPEPSDIEPTPVQQDVITQAIAALNSAVEQTGQDVETTAGYMDRAEQAADRAEQAAQGVEEYAERAETAAEAAEASATSAGQSEQTATQAASAAVTAADQAGTSAGQAQQAASDAGQAATSAVSAAENAEASATTAEAKAAEAVASASAAAGSAASAAGSETVASQAAQTASQAATQASQSATNASNSATSAAQSAASAEQSAQSAEQSAESILDVLPEIEQDISDLQDNKADKDGSYDYLTAGLANQLATDQGITDSVPYLMRPSGGGLAVGTYEQDKIVGGSIVWNQLNVNSANTSSGGGVTFTKNDNGSWTLTGTATGVYRKQFASNGQTMLLKDHVYFLSFGENFSGSASTIQIYITDMGTSSYGYNKDSIAKMGVDRNQFSVRIYSGFVAPEGGLTIVPQVFDLTAMFNPTIADYIHSLEQATAGAGVEWLRQHFPEQFDSGYQEYNSGEIKSVGGLVSHKMRDADENIIGSYPLDSDLVLRGIPKLDANNQLCYDGDTYSADGTVERRFGITSFASAKAVVLYSNNYYYTTFYMPDDAPSNNIAKTLISNGYKRISTVVPGQYYITNAGKILVIVFLDQTMTDLATVNNYLADNPITLIYELTEPTTEQATPYQTPQLVDPDGTEEYVLTEGAFPMPVGHETFYPADLKKKIEDLPGNPVSDVQVGGVSVVQGGVANVPIANANNLGVVKKNLAYGIDISSSGQLILIEPTEAQLKSGYAGSRRPILTGNQHASAFYGLAKAAGDTTQSASSNAVGAYTDEAKKAIRKMLGIPNMTSELISEITTAEDLERVEIATDGNGLPFALRACKIYVKLPASTTGVSDFVTVHYTAVDMNDNAAVTPFPTIKMTAASGSLLTYEFESFPGGMYFVRAFSSSNFGSSSGQMISIQYDKLIKYTNRIILKQYSQTTTLIPAGTIIKFYGIRYDD